MLFERLGFSSAVKKMNLFDTYLKAILGGNTNAIRNPSYQERLYVSSFYSDGVLDVDRKYAELNKIIAHIVTTDDKELFLQLLDSVVPLTLFGLDYKIVDMMEPLMIAFKPRLSELLEKSHIFCPCYEYLSDTIDKWKERHETIEHEIEFWKYLIETFKEHIEIDVRPYSLKEFTKKHRHSSKEHDRKEKLKQLYSVVVY